jgi:hypothetical protein
VGAQGNREANPMAAVVEGIYKQGKVELWETPADVPVLQLFLPPAPQ